jgi:hypothetical protein
MKKLEVLWTTGNEHGCHHFPVDTHFKYERNRVILFDNKGKLLATYNWAWIVGIYPVDEEPEDGNAS